MNSENKYILIKAGVDSEYADCPDVVVIKLTDLEKLPSEQNFKFLKETNQNVVQSYYFGLEFYDIDWEECSDTIYKLEEGIEYIFLDIEGGLENLSWLSKCEVKFTAPYILYHSTERLSFKVYGKWDSNLYWVSSVPHNEIKQQLNETT